MPDSNAITDLLFDFGTTYRTDYQGGGLQSQVKTLYKEKASCQFVRPPPLKDVHTLSQWKGAVVPFGLLHKPRPIINTDPTKVQQRYTKPEDLQREQAQMTRPRLVMTPAVSMDDIDDSQAREILVKDMYTSDMSRAMSEAVKDYFRVEAPFPGLPASSNPIVLPRLQPPRVPPEWRMETVSWDFNQLRSYCDPTKEFWLAQHVPECRACNETAIITAHRNQLRRLKGARR